jgi:SAM-dependent methyltransferase
MVQDTEQQDYTKRLKSLEQGWKRWLDVQRPYRRHLQGLGLGFVLDVGCGLGRNLLHLGGNGVGIDHNPHSVAVARQRGLTAWTPAEFAASGDAVPERFDTLLLSHVAEHLSPEELRHLLRTYLPYLSPGGRLLFITPQERGFRSDPTHVTFMDFARLAAAAREAGLTVERQYSFPFPRCMGRLFTYNEFVVICRKGGVG